MDAFHGFASLHERFKVSTICSPELVTEWKEFRSPDFDHLKNVLKAPVVFDGRNLYDPVAMKKQGFRYYAIGRGEKATS